MKRDGRGGKRGRERVHNFRKRTTPRHQRAGYGPAWMHREERKRVRKREREGVSCFFPDRPGNPAIFEVSSFTRSWDYRGYSKNISRSYTNTISQNPTDLPYRLFVCALAFSQFLLEFWVVVANL